MHLARAVGTRSAIIYGGREKHGNQVIPNEKILKRLHPAPHVGNVILVTMIACAWR